jgi:hypothetical protein
MQIVREKEKQLVVLYGGMQMKKVGIPKINIDKSNFEKLCQMQCTLEEIAGFFDCCDDTINNWCKEVYDDNFSGVYKKKSMAGKISLRRNQFKIAENNASMAIFLGKQYLGQRDSFPDEVNYTEVNKGIMNIANLINNPVKNSTEKDVEDE